MVDADPFSFKLDVRMQDAMLYSSKIRHISWFEDVALNSVKPFDLSLDGLEITVEVDPRPTKNRSDGE